MLELTLSEESVGESAPECVNVSMSVREKVRERERKGERERERTKRKKESVMKHFVDQSEKLRNLQQHLYSVIPR